MIKIIYFIKTSLVLLMLAFGAHAHTSMLKPVDFSDKVELKMAAKENQPKAAGLKSDGELVQAKKPKKPKKLIGHELTHTMQQQGRLFTSSDFNAAGASPDSAQTAGSPKPKLSPNSAVTPKKANVKKGVKDSHDRFSNMETSHQAQTIPLQNATTSNIRATQQNREHRTIKPVKIRVRLGAKCDSVKFPKSAVIENRGKSRAVECVKGKVALKGK